MSRYLTGEFCLIKTDGNGLSTNIFNTYPFFNPTITPYLPAGPPKTLQNLINESNTH